MQESMHAFAGGSSPVTDEQASMRAFAGGGATARGASVGGYGFGETLFLLGWAVSQIQTRIHRRTKKL
jgi:capsule polysaccharide export protein KpsC/LpsZ